MACASCTDEARCDRLGICQVQARAQLATRCTDCDGDGLVSAPGCGDLTDCPACKGSGRIQPPPAKNEERQ